MSFTDPGMWPAGGKNEIIFGHLWCDGSYGPDAVVIAERAFPGALVTLDLWDGARGNLVVHPDGCTVEACSLTSRPA